MVSDLLFETGHPGGEGILPIQELRLLVRNGIIGSHVSIEEEQFQPSSIDLRLSSKAFRVQASFLPGKSTTLENKAVSNGMLVETLDISKSTVLERGVIYIVPLLERLELPEYLFGIANPKSTTGRLDIFTRLITETGDEFDRVKKGYSGKLYIEILSQTFPVIVQAGMRLNQLRLGRGRMTPAGDEHLRRLNAGDDLFDIDADSGQSIIYRGVRVTIDLQGNGSDVVGYQALSTSTPLDLGKVNHYEALDFWRPIYRNEKRQFILEPNQFYILASKQRIRVPPSYAAEMLPYDLATQEFRVHYAGFFDPGFGYGRHGEIAGTRAVLEVRASHMPILLEDDQFVGRLNYFKMSAEPEVVYGQGIGSSYQAQGLTLAKHFRRSQEEHNEIHAGKNELGEEEAGIGALFAIQDVVHAF